MPATNQPPRLHTASVESLVSYHKAGAHTRRPSRNCPLCIESFENNRALEVEANDNPSGEPITQPTTVEAPSQPAKRTAKKGATKRTAQTQPTTPERKPRTTITGLPSRSPESKRARRLIRDFLKAAIVATCNHVQHETREGAATLAAKLEAEIAKLPGYAR